MAGVVWVPRRRGTERTEIARRGDVAAVIRREGASWAILVVVDRPEGMRAGMLRRRYSALPALFNSPEAAKREAENRLFGIR